MGKGVKPSYNLEVDGDGDVVFVGHERVKKQGKTEMKIDNDRFLELLSLFKNVGFFSLSDSYDYPGGQSRVAISISIPKDDGDVVTKSVSYYEDDPSVPEEVKNLEGKICDIVGVKDLIGTTTEEKRLEPVIIPPSKPVINESKQDYSKPISNRKKICILASVAVVVVILLIFLLMFFNPNRGDDTKPVFDYIGTASSVNGYKDFEPVTVFDKEGNVYVYCEFSNVIPSNDSLYNLRFDVSVFKEGELCTSFAHNVVTSVKFTFFNISTDASWDSGNYTISVDLNDINSGKIVSTEVSFELSEDEFKITEFLTEKKTDLGDYISWYFFSPGEPVYVYIKYEGYSIKNDGSCDLFIKFDIQEINGDKNLTFNITEQNSGNSFQRGTILTDDTWPSSGYYIVAVLEDRVAGKSVLESSSFFID